MLTPRQAQTAEAKNSLAVLRAVALSRKQPATVEQLLHDYTELEGHGVNYRKYGYDHFEDFIVQSGEFIIHNMQGEMYLTARPSPESHHITEMIKHQKKPKRNSALKFREPKKSDQSWNKSSYSSNVYDKLPSPKKLIKRSSNKSSSNVQRKQQQQQQKKSDTNNNSNQSNRNNVKDQQQRQSQKSKNNSSDGSSKSSQQQQQQPQQSSKETERKSKVQRQLINTKVTVTTSIQDRLKQNQKSQQHLTSNATEVKQQQQQQPQNVPNTNTQNGGDKRLQSNYTSNTSQSEIQEQVKLKQQQINYSDLTQQKQKQQQNHQLEMNYPNETINKISPIKNRLPMNTKVSTLQDRLKIAQQQQQNLTKNSDNNRINQRISSCDSPNNLIIRCSNNTSNNTVIKNEFEKTITSNKSNETDDNDDMMIAAQCTLSSVFEFNDPNLNAITSLEKYCTVRGYELPIYKFLQSRFSSKIHGRVIVNGAAYSTYPDEFEIELYAKLAAATKAIEEIKIQETRRRYPICTDSDAEIALKIYEEVKIHPNGIFHKKIPEMFEIKYEKILPDNWFSIIQESNMFITEMTVGDNIIVLIKDDILDSDATSTTTTATTAESEFDEDSDVIVIDRITLPWDKKYWNLYITYCLSTIEIWARIVDKGYNDKLDTLMNDIDVYMLTDKQRPISIICGQVYLLSISECWHRVRVEEINKENGKCLCFFIDFGDEEWHVMEQLYVCEAKFLLLPPQAVCFSLFGLEDFAENPNAKKHLSTLTGKSLVAEILTKQETYEMNDENNLMNLNNAKIQCVLYDTTTNEDINLNPILLKQICDDTQPPELRRNGVNNVYITHVHKNGDLYLQLRNMELQYVQKLINQLVESKFKKEQHKVCTDDMKKTKIFFIHDPDDQRWYRGILVTNNDDNNDESITVKSPTINPLRLYKNSNNENNEIYSIFYLDYGLTKKVPISRIYRLDSLSAALSKFPRQSIKVRLYKLPPINEKIIGLIRGLLPDETPAIVKVAVNAIIPQIIVYKRFDDKGGLFNVNESIRIEYELESSNEITDVQSANKIESHDSPISDTLGLGPHSPASSMRTLSLRTPITVPNSPQKELPKLLDNIFIPDIGEFFDVIVTMASNPSNFTVRPYNDGPKLAEMMEELKGYCSSNDEFIPVDMIEEGQAYAALNSDGYYYRVTVENIFKSMDIHVHYCDFGGVAVLSNDKLKTLPGKFRTLPKQAISAKLSDIKPTHGDWTLQDCIRFQQLTVKQKFVSIIRNVSDDPVTPGTKILELKLIDVQTDEDIYIHDIMINEGRAISC